MPSNSSRRESRRARSAAVPVDRSIRLRVRIYALIFLVTSLIVLARTVLLGWDAVVPVVACLAVGLLVGVVASRMYAMSWDEGSGTVVGRIDVIGAVVLFGYILVSVFRSQLVGTWLPSTVAAVAGLAVLAGIMAGQAVGTGGGVLRILRVVRSGAVPPSVQ